MSADAAHGVLEFGAELYQEAVAEWVRESKLQGPRQPSDCLVVWETREQYFILPSAAGQGAVQLHLDGAKGTIRNVDRRVLDIMRETEAVVTTMTIAQCKEGLQPPFICYVFPQDQYLPDAAVLKRLRKLCPERTIPGALVIKGEVQKWKDLLVQEGELDDDEEEEGTGDGSGSGEEEMDAEGEDKGESKGGSESEDEEGSKGGSGSEEEEGSKGGSGSEEEEGSKDGSESEEEGGSKDGKGEETGPAVARTRREAVKFAPAVVQELRDASYNKTMMDGMMERHFFIVDKGSKHYVLTPKVKDPAIAKPFTKKGDAYKYLVQRWADGHVQEEWLQQRAAALANGVASPGGGGPGSSKKAAAAAAGGGGGGGEAGSSKKKAAAGGGGGGEAGSSKKKAHTPAAAGGGGSSKKASPPPADIKGAFGWPPSASPKPASMARAASTKDESELTRVPDSQLDQNPAAEAETPGRKRGVKRASAEEPAPDSRKAARMSCGGGSEKGGRARAAQDEGEEEKKPARAKAEQQKPKDGSKKAAARAKTEQQKPKEDKKKKQEDEMRADAVMAEQDQDQDQDQEQAPVPLRNLTLQSLVDAFPAPWHTIVEHSAAARKFLDRDEQPGMEQLLRAGRAACGVPDVMLLHRQLQRHLAHQNEDFAHAPPYLRPIYDAGSCDPRQFVQAVAWLLWTYCEVYDVNTLRSVANFTVGEMLVRSSPPSVVPSLRRAMDMHQLVVHAAGAPDGPHRAAAALVLSSQVRQRLCATVGELVRPRAQAPPADSDTMYSALCKQLGGAGDNAAETIGRFLAVVMAFLDEGSACGLLHHAINKAFAGPDAQQQRVRCMGQAVVQLMERSWDQWAPSDEFRGSQVLKQQCLEALRAVLERYPVTSGVWKQAGGEAQAAAGGSSSGSGSVEADVGGVEAEVERVLRLPAVQQALPLEQGGDGSWRGLAEHELAACVNLHVHGAPLAATDLTTVLIRWGMPWEGVFRLPQQPPPGAANWPAAILATKAQVHQADERRGRMVAARAEATLKVYRDFLLPRDVLLARLKDLPKYSQHLEAVQAMESSDLIVNMLSMLCKA